MTRRDEILSKIAKIPSLPPVAAESIALLKDSDTSIAKIAKLIERDPALAANLLRIANSAFLGLPVKVDSVRAAIVRLGTSKVSQVVTGFAVMPQSTQPLTGYGLPRKSLWENALAVATATDELTKLAGKKPPADAYTAGLLHDLGKLVLDPFVAEAAQEIGRFAFEEIRSFDAAEREVLGIDHAEAGAALLDSWHLPENLVAAVRYHHEPESAPPQLTELVDLLHLGDQIVMMSGIGVGIDGTHYRTSTDAVSRLDIRPSLVDQALGKTMIAFQEIRSLYGPSTQQETAA